MTSFAGAAGSAVRALSFGYRPRAGVFQRSHAPVVVAWCAAAGVVVAIYQNPLVITAVLAASLALARRCRVERETIAAVLLAAPIAVVMALVNPIATQNGITVLLAGIHVPVLGTFDVTREAVIYGLILGLRSITIFAVCALYVSTVDPDDLLRVLRRFSVRSAITASLATRFVPLLARDGANMAMARRCRPGEPPPARAVVRSMFARSLDRAGDAAVALETRGFALARPLRTRPPAPRAADWLVLVSAVATFCLAVAGAAAGLARFADYPLTMVAAGPSDVAFAIAVGLTAAAPALAPRRPEQSA